MEEGEYKSTYDEITRINCVFEKALTNNQCRCRYAKHFWLADREGYACRNADASSQCTRLLQQLRENSRFLLKLPTIGNQLPHNMEIRVQAGGLNGLNQMFGESDTVEDVRQLVETAVSAAGDLDALPYSEIVRSVADYKVRSRRKNR